MKSEAKKNEEAKKNPSGTSISVPASSSSSTKSTNVTAASSGGSASSTTTNASSVTSAGGNTSSSSSGPLEGSNWGGVKEAVVIIGGAISSSSGNTISSDSGSGSESTSGGATTNVGSETHDAGAKGVAVSIPAPIVPVVSRDYTIIVDKSGSMEGSRWEEAKEALKILAPSICKADPDGITLYFFNDWFNKFDNVKTAEEVEKLFKSQEPNGCTNLAAVLADAVKPDTVFQFGVRGRAETILVITDGEPDSKDKVEEVIIKATKEQMTSDEDLSISFIQIGKEKSAETFLERLDDGLKSKGAAFDIVDTLTFSEMKGLSFKQIIELSIRD